MIIKDCVPLLGDWVILSSDILSIESYKVPSSSKEQAIKELCDRERAFLVSCAIERYENRRLYLYRKHSFSSVEELDLNPVYIEAIAFVNQFITGINDVSMYPNLFPDGNINNVGAVYNNCIGFIDNINQLLAEENKLRKDFDTKIEKIKALNLVGYTIKDILST